MGGARRDSLFGAEETMIGCSNMRIPRNLSPEERERIRFRMDVEHYLIAKRAEKREELQFFLLLAGSAFAIYKFIERGGFDQL